MQISWFSRFKHMHFFFFFIIHLHFWLSKIQLILTLFYSRLREWLTHCSRSRLFFLYYSLWEQSFPQSAENCCLVGGIFTSAWLLLRSAKLKIAPQHEVIGLRIWYFQKNHFHYHSLPPLCTPGPLPAFPLCRLEPVSCNKLWCSNFMSQRRVLLLTCHGSFLLSVNLAFYAPSPACTFT